MSMWHRRQFGWSALLVAMLLLLPGIAPPAAGANQIELATPIAADPLPSESAPDGGELSSNSGPDDGDLQASSITSAYFNSHQYEFSTGSVEQAVLVIEVAGITEDESYEISVTGGFALGDPVAIADAASGVTCTASASGNVISGSFAKSTIGPANCRVSFTITNVSFSGPYEFVKAALSTQPGDFVAVGQLVVDRGGGLTWSFDKDIYTAAIGENVTMKFTLQIPAGMGGEVGFGAYGTYFVYTNASVATQSVPGLCTAGVGEDSGITGVGILFDNATDAAANCTISITLHPQDWPGDGFGIQIPIEIDANGTLLGTSVLLQSHAAATSTLALTLGDAAPFPGDTVGVSVSHTHTAYTGGENDTEYGDPVAGTMQVTLPAGVTYVAASGTAQCGTVDCDVVSIVTSLAGDAVILTYITPQPGNLVTFGFSVDIGTTAATGVPLAFTASGEAGSGINAASTGSDTKNLTVRAALNLEPLSFSVPYNGSHDGALAASGGAGPYTFEVTNEPDHGLLSPFSTTTGAFTYTAAALYAGSDAFTVKVTDTLLHTAEVTVNVTILAPPSLEGSAPQNLVVPFGGSLNGTIDASGGAPGYNFSVTAPATYGVASFADAASGNFSYTSNASGSGADQFTVQVSDSLQPVPNVTFVTVNVLVLDQLLANPVSLTVPFEGTAGGAIVATGGMAAYSFEVEDDPAHGTLPEFDTGSGAFIYEANDLATGPDQFTVTVTDQKGSQVTATVQVTILEQLVAADVNLTVPYLGSGSGTIVATGGLPGGYQFLLDESPLLGAVTALDGATGAFTYTSLGTGFGADQFTLRVVDTYAPLPNVVIATVHVTIPEPLIAGDLDLTVPYRGTASAVIIASGGTPGYGFAVEGGPGAGVLTSFDTATGALAYTANDLATGPDQFTVRVTDQAMPVANSVIVTVRITIGDPAPLATTPHVITPNPGQTVTGNLADLVNGGMPGYTFALLGGAAQGIATVNPDGTFSFAANATASGSDSFTFMVTDSEPLAGVNAAASVTGVVTVQFAALPATATATATMPDGGSTPPVTPTATSPDAATATATSPDNATASATPPDNATETATQPDREPGGIATVPGTAEAPPVRTTQSPDPPASSATGISGGVTALPSTGANSTPGDKTWLVWVVLGGAMVLLTGGGVCARRSRM